MTNEAAEFDSAKKNVLICDTQPVAVEGMKWLIENSGDLRFAGSVPTLEAVYALLNPDMANLEVELATARVVSEMEGLAEEAAEDGALAAHDSVEVPEVMEAPDCRREALETEALAIPADTGEPPPVQAEISVEAPFEALTEPVMAAIAEPIDAVVIDKGLGMAGVMDLLQKLTSTSHRTVAVVWGTAINEAEALRLLQAGAKGILRRTSESGTLLTCLRAVTAGGTWMEDGIFGSTEKLFNPRRSELTQREREVVVLVEKGLRNRDIARMLGIQTGTVKIHLKHIFEKTGVRGRYGLAFTGLQSKGSIAMTAPVAHFTA